MEHGLLTPVLPITADLCVCRAVMLEWCLRIVCQLRCDFLCQDLSEFHSPLVEAVDVPNDTLGKDAMLIKRNEVAQYFGCQAIRKDRICRAIALKGAMGNKPCGCSFGFHLVVSLAECQRFRLREEIRHQ